MPKTKKKKSSRYDANTGYMQGQRWGTRTKKQRAQDTRLPDDIEAYAAEVMRRLERMMDHDRTAQMLYRLLEHMGALSRKSRWHVERRVERLRKRLDSWVSYWRYRDSEVGRPARLARYDAERNKRWDAAIAALIRGELRGD